MILCCRWIFLLFTAAHLLAYNWDRVYLVSFPRSGSHWMRFLVEEAGRIATSSVYRDLDYPHLAELFPWGGYSTDHGYTGKCRYPLAGETVLIKTHYPCLPKPLLPTNHPKICLVRHPIDSLYSFYIYQGKKERVGFIPPEDLFSLIRRWKTFYNYWAGQENVIFIRYEDLYENPGLYLTKILDILGYRTGPLDIERAIQNYPPQGALLKHKHHYTKHALEWMQRELKDLLLKYNYEL